MKALFRAALMSAILAMFIFVLPTAAIGAPNGNAYGHCINAGNPGHQGDDSNGRGHAADGGECEDDDDRPANTNNGGGASNNDNHNNAGGNGNNNSNEGNANTNNAGGNGNNENKDEDKDKHKDAGGTTNAHGNNAGGNGNNTGGNGNGNGGGSDDDDRTHPHGNDMPGRGLGHCKHAGEGGHDYAEEHGRGHLRDGGECDEDDDDDTPARGNDRDRDRDDDDDDDDRDRDRDRDDEGRTNGDDDDDDDDNDDDGNRVNAAGDDTMPIGFVDTNGDGFDDTTGLTAPQFQAAGANTEGEVVLAAAGGLAAPALTAAGDDAGATPTPGRIDAGLGWLRSSTGQNLAALVAMSIALTLGFVALMRRRADEEV